MLTRAYVDLIFAFGHAHLGDVSATRRMISNAEGTLTEVHRIAPTFSPVGEMLLAIFKSRIENRLLGRLHTGPIPEELAIRLNETMKRRDPNGLRFVVNRFRAQSRVLEPLEHVDAYRHSLPQLTRFDADLELLRDAYDPKYLRTRIDQMLTGSQGRRPTAAETVEILCEALPLAPRVSEAYALDLVNRIEPTIGETCSPQFVQGVHGDADLFERGAQIAGLYQSRAHLKNVYSCVLRLLTDTSRFQHVRSRNLPKLFAQMVDNLHRLELRDELCTFAEQADRALVGNRSFAELRQTASKNWPILVAQLLPIARARFVLGERERASDVTRAAMELLFTERTCNYEDGLYPHTYCILACQHIHASAADRFDLASASILEAFRRFRLLDDSLTTSRYFALWHLQIIEAAVWATLGEQQNPLDDPELNERRAFLSVLRSIVAETGWDNPPYPGLNIPS